MNLGKGFLFGGLFVALMGVLISGNVSSPSALEQEELTMRTLFVGKLKDLPEEELALVIDSLLSLPKIPSSLLQAVNLRVRQIRLEQEMLSLYPAQQYYDSWNNKIAHPYKDDLSAKDTTVNLLLTDEMTERTFVNPFDGYISSSFGWRDGKMHNGIDIVLNVGDTIKAAFDGVVRLSRWQGGYGRAVIIRHYNGLETIYGHLYRFLVKEGAVVKAGQAIGKGGNSGASRGSHLHLETRFKGKPINPESFINFKEGKLKSNTVILKKTRMGFIAHQPGGAYHKIKRGDFLYKIATEYGTTVKEICKMNGFQRNHHLVVGEEIKVAY